jgi:steroid delta-isomerase-like uncharacterized protein
MTHDQIGAFAHEYLRAWERADVRSLTDAYADAGQIDSPMFHTVSGRDSIAASFTDLFRGLSDWRFTVEDMVIDTSGEEERVVLLMTAQATHAGEMFGFPATGRRTTTRSVHALRLKDGRIVHETRLYDFTGLLVQLGVLKAKGG